MRIQRIQIKNFRNFEGLDVVIGENAVILGENRVGKSNLIFALRLILDPSLPDTARRLRFEDFWDGLPRPLTAEHAIEVSVDFAGFEDNVELTAVMADHLVEPDPMVARITYRFGPTPDLEDAPLSEADYEFTVFGGGRPENAVGYELRRWLPLDVFPALRDAESDLTRWSRSPLRPLLDRAGKVMDQKKLVEVAEEVQAATSKVAQLPEISSVVAAINSKLEEMVGSSHAIQTALGFAPTDPDRLLRSLQMLVDGGTRGVGDASLGSSNVLYLALKHLEYQQLAEEGERQHTFLAIEEPEAHLHPHVQRLIYSNYLRARGEAGENPAQARSVLLTTHSPNVASVAPLESVVVLRKTKNQGTIGRSLAAIKLSVEEREDLERFLDVTRGELFFSRAVILVEGDSEKFLLPTLARLQDPALDFDSLGITVCSISGTHFTPYVKLLGPKGLNIPSVILTDYDPKGDASSQEDADPDSEGVVDSYGENRVVNQIMQYRLPKKDWDDLTYDQILKVAPRYGVFLNEHTFEVDLFRAGTHEDFSTAIESLTSNKKMVSRFAKLAADPAALDTVAFLKDINSLGKGRFAQRLAAVLHGSGNKACPSYISKALSVLKRKVA